MKIFIILLLVMSAFAEKSNCPKFFQNNQAPDIKIKHQELCFEQFVISYSTDFKNPLYGAEVLNLDLLTLSNNIKRKDEFHQEPRILLNQQANISSFHNTNFDKGHIVPAADMSTKNAQFESFSIVNMTPQNSNNNRVLWKQLETYTRNLAKKYDTVYVISGPIFSKNSNKLNDGTFIPDAYFKIIYIQKINKISSFYCKNLPNQKYELKTILEIESITGYKFSQFPLNIKNKSEYFNLF